MGGCLWVKDHGNSHRIRSNRLKELSHFPPMLGS